jgi:5-(aminomethyl)-3-furanmethanol phosphate kinase
VSHDTRITIPGWSVGRLTGSPTRPAGGGWVVKCGGSLLALPDWPERLRGVCGSLSDEPPLLVIGGGALVEGLRAIDAACPQPAERMHRLAIAAMRLTARLVAEVLELSLAGPDTPRGSNAAVADPTAWSDADTVAGLPRDWTTTSDSIAAGIAAAAGGRLLLLKRSLPPGDGSATQAAAAGWVDPAFVEASTTIATWWASPLG